MTNGNWIDLNGAKGYLAEPAGGGGPGVLVLHAWWGLTPVFTRLCDQLAGEGFVALAPDLYQGRTTDTIEGAEAMLKQRDLPATQAAAIAAVEALARHPAVRAPKGLGAVGFSMGAAWAALLAGERPADLTAVVLFYGTVEIDPDTTRAAFLGHFGEADDWEPLEGVRAMEAQIRAAGRELTLHLYPGAGHWFFEDNRPDAYQPEAAALAWTRTLEFLRQHLEP
jgi:carboxymethylenebutenolidase